MYDKFKEWAAKMLVGDEVTLEVLANAVNAEYDDPRNPIVMFVRECLAMRAYLSDEKLVRFLKEARWPCTCNEDIKTDRDVVLETGSLCGAEF